MADEIVNRVANSVLEVIDLEDLYPSGERVVFDISKWLYEGFVLREKEFRLHVANCDWSKFQDAYIALTCSTDAIVPAWAYMLVSLQLEPFAKQTVVGSLEQLESSIFQNQLTEFDVKPFQDKPVIIKGCSNKPVPLNAYIFLAQKLRSVAKSIMYGEACSSVPLYKHKK
ncbi:MAG: hypothetical protein BM564_11940 [Bacteroidetes bacterium MedPE-SWsnd-G2]|nr:MAG: hypothetical protein BM564_11940 [Bacteroidetes bacterium MedPE-SWsnd-G2]